MARRHLNVRLSEPGIARLEALRDEYDVTLTEVVRVVISIGFNHPAQIKETLEHLRRTK